MNVASLMTVALAIHLLAESCPGQSQPTQQSQMSQEAAPGAIVVDVLDADRPEHYWQYEVRPSTGQVRLTLQREFKDRHTEDIPRTFQQPAGAMTSCGSVSTSGLTSPDGKYIAQCTGDHLSKLEGLTLIDTKTSAVVFRWNPTEWRGVQGFAWAPNSKSFAVLNHSEYYGKKPLELLAGASGHPVPHDTEFIDIIDPYSAKVTEYLVRKNVLNAFSRILSWSK